METADSEDADGASLRVSSLRSRFESMASLKQHAVSPADVKSSHTRPLLGEIRESSQPTGRKSVDLQAGALSGSVEGIKNEPTFQKGVVANSRHPAQVSQSISSSRQRPSSMVSLSPSPVFPTKVTGPPLSSSAAVKAPDPEVTPLAKDLQASSTMLSSKPKAPAVPPPRHSRQLSHIKAPILPPALTDRKTSDVSNDKTGSSAFTQAKPTGNETVSTPLPRFEKPKIPIKPTSALQTPGKSGSQPGTSVTENRKSPFSTPPSSEENQVKHEFMTVRSSQASSESKADSYFQGTAPKHVDSATRHMQTASPDQKNGRRDPREFGFTRSLQQQNGSPERRPDLPPRRDLTRPSPGNLDMTQGRASPPQADISSIQKRRDYTSRSMAEPRSTIHDQTLKLDFLPPPKKISPPDSLSVMEPPPEAQSHISRPAGSRMPSVKLAVKDPNQAVLSAENAHIAPGDYPDASRTNRRPPFFYTGMREIQTKYDTKLFDICGENVCTTGYLTRAWNVISGKSLMTLDHGEGTKVTALAFKPAASAKQEGSSLWLGTNYGDMQEVDITTQSVVCDKSNAHTRREIIKIYRHKNTMWSLDEDGKLNVWLPDDTGLPNLNQAAVTRKVPKGHTFSLIIGEYLWHAVGKDIRIFSPGSSGEETFQVLQSPLSQSGAGEITSGAVISTQLNRVYFGHADGKVSIYTIHNYSCIGIVNVSAYKINSLAGVGNYLWAGYNTGMIYVYDTQSQPWTVKKDWHAHDHPVAQILVDRSSVWKLGRLQIASIGTDNAVRLWDGMLEDDWLEEDLRDHDVEFCHFREIKTVVATWNAGASTPPSLRYDEKDTNFFRDIIQVDDPPDVLVFGFQELVDLEDKTLTAKSFFKVNKKKDPSDQDQMSRQYRTWRDYLVRCVEDSMPTDEPYHLLHTANMVGLFSCIFVKSSERKRIRNVETAEVKRGLGGLHGNKGALIVRFVLDDSSMCFVNCHLAAGQSQTINRHNDIAAILETEALPPEKDLSIRRDIYIGGGDGTLVSDHEICVLNGDLNYRIDSMGRDIVIKAIRANDLTKLLSRDQLLVSMRRNPGFRLRIFHESPITFPPTYKYDIGTDRYDTSDKHRAPAWCDRMLYCGVGRIKQLDYRRHDLRISDHRPVSGTFLMRIKSISPEKRAVVWQACEERFASFKQLLTLKVKIEYLVNVLGIPPAEARSLVDS